MSTESREHLSCLMDGEISRETGRFLVRRLGSDAELCATWARYHLVRDCLRHQEGGLASADLTLRVSQAIERDGLPARPAGRRSVWLKSAAGVAVAASVALMAIVAVGPGRPGAEQNAVSGDVAAAPSFTAPQALTRLGVEAPRQASLSGGSESRSRMNPYLLRHYQATGFANGKGFVTFVPIVVTSAAESEEDSGGGQTPESEEAAQSQ